MMKTCAELFRGMSATIIGNEAEPITGLAYNSREVRPGDAFFCIVGFTVDGHTFAQDAIDRGAKVLVVERKLYLAETDDVTLVVVSDSREALAQAAAVFFDHPSDAFNLVGITGTNGKTTTTYLVEHIASHLGKRTGVIGTVGIKIGDETRHADHTTPESSDLQAILADMRDAGCETVAMEVSSHAIDLLRVWGTSFAVTAFTNLTQDHLDYHHTFEAYFEAKAKLFTADYPASRVVNIDDAWGKELARRCEEADDDLITVGFDEDADIRPFSYECFADRTHVVLSALGDTYEFDYPLVGRFNVSNVMLAFGIAYVLGFKKDAIVEALSDANPVPGRLERVRAADDGGISVYVDYAHTPDALKKAIGAVRELNPAHLITVFGCGGDRDATKRSIMGKVSLDSDFIVVTSDNPRSEDPNAIIEAIVSGMGDGQGRFIVEPDRRSAIAAAIAHAAPGDAILIAGKGHEDYQLVGSQVLSFDDRIVAAEELDRAFGGKA